MPNPFLNNNVADNGNSSNAQSISNDDTLKYLASLQNSANYASLTSARETNAFNAAEAEKNRQFQLEMSNSSYQRAVSDLLKAGLNPVLAYMNGGASTSSGSQASGVSAKFDSGIGALASIISSSQNNATNMEIARLNAKNNYEMNKKDNETSKYIAELTQGQYNTSSKRSMLSQLGGDLIRSIAYFAMAKSNHKTVSAAGKAGLAGEALGRYIEAYTGQQLYDQLKGQWFK